MRNPSIHSPTGGRVLSGRWTLSPSDEQGTRALSESLGISPLLARLLLNRGVSTAEQARSFLDLSLKLLPSPFLIPDMDCAVDRLCAAIRARERICIYGDYDLDGISATAILERILSHYGADVLTFIPRRDREGYGLQLEAVQALVGSGVRLIVTCDNGTSAHAPIAHARMLGVDVIVTDHHSLPDVLPAALAVLNPIRPETPSELRALSGAGVAFMLALALRKGMRDRHWTGSEPNLKQYLDLVALGTVADVVPLSWMNRLLVQGGLEMLAQRRRPGIRALLARSGVGQDEAVTVTTVGFRLAPRLNSAGRLDDASLAVKLLTTDSLEEAAALAERLERLNRTRQQLEEGALAELKTALDTRIDEVNSGQRRPGGSVFASPRWHPGVIGIVAARVVERTQAPSIVLSIRDGLCLGSGRSVPGFDLVDALRRCDSLLERFGGHPMAAGLALSERNLEPFSQRFEEISSEMLARAPDARIRLVDAELPLEQVTEALVEDLHRLSPFGPGNPEPVFWGEGGEVLSQRVVGRGHLRFRLRVGERSLDAIGFRLADKAELLRGAARVQLAYRLEFNHFRGTRSLQMHVLDLVPVLL